MDSFSTPQYPTGFSETIVDSTILNLSSSWCDLGCDHIEPGKFNVDNDQRKEMKSNKEFKMANLNINSLLKYIDELILRNYGKTPFDILSINEAKIDHRVSGSEISIAGYNIVRKDRNIHMVSSYLCIFVNLYPTLNEVTKYTIRWECYV